MFIYLIKEIYIFLQEVMFLFWHRICQVLVTCPVKFC